VQWWQIILLGAVALLAVLVIGGFVLWRTASPQTRALARRVERLPWRAKLGLAKALVLDGRIPLFVRAIPPALVLYLAMPLDIVPDFVPVLGQLDDVLVVAVSVGLMLRLTPLPILEAHLSTLEGRYGVES